LTPSRKSFLVIGLLTFVAGTVLLFPARVAYQWFVPEGIQLGGIEGSIWSGSAREMSGGGMYLRDVQWRLHPLRLFTGKLGLGIEASPGSGIIEADVALGPGGRRDRPRPSGGTFRVRDAGQERGRKHEADQGKDRSKMSTWH